MKKLQKNLLQEPSADYDKAESDLLKAALSRSYTERFHVMTQLMKMNLLLRKTNVTHKSISGFE